MNVDACLNKKCYQLIYLLEGLNELLFPQLQQGCFVLRKIAQGEHCSIPCYCVRHVGGEGKCFELFKCWDDDCLRIQYCQIELLWGVGGVTHMYIPRD